MKLAILATVALPGGSDRAFARPQAASGKQTASILQDASARQTSTPQNPQATPQNPPPPPEANPAPPGQKPDPSPQNPPPSAQLPEPPIKNPEVQPAPKPALATPTLTIPRLNRAPALDDFLSMEPEGEIAQRMANGPGFEHRNPHDGEKISEDTAAYLGYDQKNLYIVFVCFDDPRKVRARLSRREDIYDDAQVEVMLSTFHDPRPAHAFQTTPLGVQWDAI